MRKKSDGVVIVPILVGLAVAALVWVASYRGGGPKLADTAGTSSAVASTPLPASALSDTSMPAIKPAEMAQANAKD